MRTNNPIAYIASLALVALTLVAAPQARAVTTVFTSQATFLAAHGAGAYTETFTGGASFTQTQSFANSGFAYNVTATDNAATGIYRSGTFLGNNTSTQGLVFTFTSGNIYAVGGNFFLTNNGDNVITGTMDITLNDGTNTTYFSTAASDFRGFFSTTPITSLTIAPNAAFVFNSMDNLTVNATVVPEIGTLALLVPALALIVMRRKRAVIVAA